MQTTTERKCICVQIIGISVYLIYLVSGKALFQIIHKSLPMYNLLKVGEEVTFPGLLDIRLIIEEVHENRGNVRCKYYDDHLKRYIRLTLPADALVP